jgi:fatty acid desaturase
MDDIRQHLSQEQFHAVQQKSNAQAAAMLLGNWGLIIASFGLVIAFPTMWAYAIAAIVLGGRHLGLGIMMHECAHRALTPSRAANEWIGQWLCAAPVFADMEVYRAYHMTHHVKTGTADDPDLANYSGYPVSTASLLRKFARDLLGLTGLKTLGVLIVLYAYPDPRKLKSGYSYRKDTVNTPASKETQAALDTGRPRFWNFLRNARRILLVQAIGFSVLWALGHPLVYLLWPATWMTVYMLFTRIRNAAEHGGLAGTMSTDPWANTRSVYARWWERLTVAPNYVNFHREHHLLPTVPSYKLPQLHRLLKEKGVIAQHGAPTQGYGAVLRELVKRPTV